jgi:hypothetical protein
MFVIHYYLPLFLCCHSCHSLPMFQLQWNITRTKNSCLKPIFYYQGHSNLGMSWTSTWPKRDIGNHRVFFVFFIHLVAIVVYHLSLKKIGTPNFVEHLDFRKKMWMSNELNYFLPLQTYASKFINNIFVAFGFESCITNEVEFRTSIHRFWKFENYVLMLEHQSKHHD